MKTSAPWKTAPISQTCEHLMHDTAMCDSPTSFCYPAMGGGWMALCEAHAQKHRPQVDRWNIHALIMGGEKFA